MYNVMEITMAINKGEAFSLTLMGTEAKSSFSR